MAQIEDVQKRLETDAQRLQAEIDDLRREMAINQDPNRMQLIQEMISLCVPLQVSQLYQCVILGLDGTNVAYTRESYRVRGRCEEHNEGHPNVGSGEEEPHTQHDDFEEVPNVEYVLRNDPMTNVLNELFEANALGQLEGFIKEKNYGEIAQSLSVCRYCFISARTKVGIGC